MIKFEYKIMAVEAIKDKQLSASGEVRENHILAKLGMAGWELIAIYDGLAYFKRELNG